MHEPLTSLQGLIDALEADEVPQALIPRVRAHTRVLVRRLAALTDDLALVSEEDPDAPRLTHEDIDLHSVVMSAARLFPDIEVHLEAAPALHVRGDARRLRQLIINVISNARRRGARPLFLYAAEDGRTVTLRVRDPGPPEGHELFIIDLLVHAHGGRTCHDAISDSLVLSMPRATQTVRPHPDLLPSA